VLTWLDARCRDGGLVLRIEDIDSPRVRPSAIKQTMEDLAWLGLNWDGEYLLQSTQLAAHQQALTQLIQADLVYPCICTRNDIAAAASAPHAGDEGPLYPGTCRDRFASFAAAEAASTSGVAWRFRVEQASHVAWQDLFAGQQSFQVDAQLGDFVVWKKDGAPAYQLAVVVDDAAQQVQQVIRGDDLLPSTARQILLNQALGFSDPEWGHIPLVVGLDGRRLAKRHGDTSLRSLRAQGVDALQVLQWVAKHSGLGADAALGNAKDIATWQSLALQAYQRCLVPSQPVLWRGEFV